MVLLAGFVALAVGLWAVAQHKSKSKIQRIVTSTFLGLAHLQVIVGLVLYFKQFNTAQTTMHGILMAAAAIDGQILVSVGRRRWPDNPLIPTAAVASSLLLMAVGIMVGLDRGLFQATVFHK